MKPFLSVVIPVYNESESIVPLAAELEKALQNAGIDWEAIWIDDGSRDGSWIKIKSLPASRHKGLRFTRNFGQTAAMSAGIKEASGQWIATMDSDMQNDPADIPEMLSAALKGADVVSGWRTERKDAFFARKLPSMVANFIISFSTGVRLHDYGCTLKIYKAETIKDLEMFGEMHRFLPALLGYSGAVIREMPVNHRPRTSGDSKYGSGRIIKVVLDLMTVKFMGEFITKPIYLFGGIGISMLAISAIMAAYTIYNKMAHAVFVKDQPLFLVAIFTTLIGFQFGFMGLMAEVLSRTYHRIGDRTPYKIREKTGF